MKKNIIYLLTALFSVNIWAVPAKLDLIKHVQPDGTEVMLRKIGDERAHMTLTPEGYPVTRDANGFYCFAELGDDGIVKPLDIKVKNYADLSQTERVRVDAIDINKVNKALQARREATKMVVGSQLISRAVGGIGLMDDALYGRKELKGLVILAQYQDVQFSETCSKEFFEEMLNREGFDKYNATGSARDYFIASSTGQFIPEFDVYGPVTLPKNMAYYGQNTSTGDDMNPARMIYDACLGLDAEINFAEYDLDGNGEVDNVFVFYAGYGEASYGEDDSVWPHQWSLSDARLNLELDGVTINKYACCNELELNDLKKPVPCGIGTFVHEFSHVLGLPDLYVTSGYGSWTPSIWSVLDQGPYNNKGRTPPAYSAYERYSLGWLEPNVISGPANIELKAIDKSNTACIIPTNSDNEFFLIENRQQQGWDEYIPGHGMLVWHIDFNKSIWTRNTVNNRSSHCYVDLEEACGKWYDIKNYLTVSSYYKALADYAFPGPKGITSFTDDTTPSMRMWSGEGLALPITDIAEENGVISFKVAGGQSNAAVPVVQEPLIVGAKMFEAAWLPAEGAAGYQLYVRPVAEGEEYGEDIATFGEKGSTSITLPEGWELISTAGLPFSDSGYFGKSSPALKLSKRGVGVMTPLYDNDIVELSFWMRGQTVKGSTLIVEGLVGGDWMKIDELDPPSANGEVYEYKKLPEGMKQVRITYNKSVGNTALDDLTIRFYHPTTVLEGYDGLDVGDVTSYAVVNLPEDVKKFAYKVRAFDSDGSCTSWSEEQIVDMDAAAGIHDIIAGNKGAVKVEGRRIIWQGSRNASVTLADLCGRVVASTSSDDSGTADISAPGSGLYLLITPDGTTKLVVK